MVNRKKKYELLFPYLALFGLLFLLVFQMVITYKHLNNRFRVTEDIINIKVLNGNLDFTNNKNQIISAINNISKVYIDKYDLKINYKIYISDNRETLMYDSKSEKIKQHQFTKKGFYRLENNKKLFFKFEFQNRNLFVFRELLLLVLIFVFLISFLLYEFRIIELRINKLKQVDDFKNEFISNLTHEFKTPISSINLASEMLSLNVENKDHQTTKQLSRIIVSENAKLNELVESALINSMLSSNTIELNFQKIELNDLINKVIRKIENSIIEKGGQISFISNGKPIYIIGDSYHTEMLLTKIIDNSSKYSSNRLKISIFLTKVKDAIEIRIIDQGIGIPKDKIANVFDNLYRVSTGNVHTTKGLGLGLYYVKKIAELNDWKIALESEEGIGTSFFITITKLTYDG